MIVKYVERALGNALEDTVSASMLSELSLPMVDGAAGEILGAIKQAIRENKEPNIVEVDKLTGHKHTDYIVELVNSFRLASQQKAYISAIKEITRREERIETAKEYLEHLEDGADLSDADTMMYSALIAEGFDERKAMHMRQAATELFDYVHEKKEAHVIKFGIEDLDKNLGNIHGPRLVVVGARPAVGKSALALSAALNTEGTILFCSYEMMPMEIMCRALANVSGLDASRIMNKELTHDEKMSLSKHYHKLDKDVWFATDANTPDKIRAEALKIQRNGGDLRLIVVDYLQLMRSGEKAESRRVEVGQISRRLKMLALELNIPVMALSQLNRASAMTAIKEPSMSELRESGDIEQDADIIVLMYEHEKYENADQMYQNGLKPVVLMVEKNRGGASGRRFLTAFKGAQMKFLKVAEVMP